MSTITRHIRALSATAAVVTSQMSLRRMRRLSISDIAQHVQVPETLSNTQTCLEQLLDACAAWHPTAEPTPQVPVRVFLAAYMIALHPDAVFQSAPPEVATALAEAAAALTRQFDRLVKELARPAGTAQTPRLVALSERFRERLGEYHGLFVAWKRDDTRRLAERLHGILCTLLGSLLDAAGPDEDIEATDRDDVLQLREQIEWARARLRRLAPDGPAQLSSFDATSARLLGARNQFRLLREQLADMMAPLEDDE